jgi:transketolase
MKGASPYGRIIHFGIREHAMGSILNGIALHGLARGFGGTFLVFSDYMRGAVRLAALMKLPVTFIWSHDSIGLGEDGPTHQPIEHIASLRAIPGLDVIRPADANEVVACWLEIIKRDKAAGLLLSRQNLPVINRSLYKSTAEVGRGAYALNEVSSPDVLIIASGSEVSIALKASEELAQKGLKARVISAPCLEWYREQEQGYKDLLMPKSVKARVSVEAGIAQGWHEFIGDSGVAISLEHYGASASAPVLFKEFGFTAEAVVKACQESISKSSK